MRHMESVVGRSCFSSALRAFIFFGWAIFLAYLFFA